MTRYGLLLLTAMLATGCAMTPPAEDPVLIKLEEIDRRLSAVERVLANGSLVDLTVQVDNMQRESAEMRGRTESLEHESEKSVLSAEIFGPAIKLCRKPYFGSLDIY